MPPERRASSLSPLQVIRSRWRRDSVGSVKKALMIVASLALVALLWMNAAKAMAAQHDAARPVTRGATETTEVLRVQTVQVDTFEIDMHDGGVWGQPQSDANGG